ncbi:hypothetical protein F0562_011272 [Nyssa sinensis]|uniref:Uncharacterized protein n=1 Tax=Nyssa sinensis TaxID=561372 RepID=A0A5J5A3H7_9ASTE|nr:hypothetical protein F0562_011272 [Nyssa sinensis]
MLRMVEQIHQNNLLNIAADEKKRPNFCINDHVDILVEILKRLDGHSLGVTACLPPLVFHLRSFWRSGFRSFLSDSKLDVWHGYVLQFDFND